MKLGQEKVPPWQNLSERIDYSYKIRTVVLQYSTSQSFFSFQFKRKQMGALSLSHTKPERKSSLKLLRFHYEIRETIRQN